MLENFKKSVDDGKHFGVLLTDLSKAFNCIDHKLLIAKLFWYRGSPTVLNLVYSYLTNRTQRTKINNSFSRQSNTEYGVPQGSVLSPLLFNINLIDLFYECEDSNIANYAYDITPHTCGENIRAVISELQSLAFRLFKWFENNHMKANQTKSLSNNKAEKVMTINDVAMTSSDEEKLLSIILDSKLKFERHITGICNKATQKYMVCPELQVTETSHENVCRISV